MDPRTLPKPLGGSRDRASQVPYLFLAMEAGRPVAGSARYSLADVDSVEIGRGVSRAVNRAVGRGGRMLRVDLPDPWMSQAHARIDRRGVVCTLTDAGSRNGSLVNDAAVTGAVTLHDGDRIELGGSFFVYRASLPALDPPDVLDAERTVAPDLARRMSDLARVAGTDVAVVLHGPSGSGKEVVARTIHGWSRRTGAFVPVNCGALPSSLAESELFGYRRGAFSGAIADKVGLVAAADGGTLFLDEIGDLPTALQPVLLRALQERAITPVGAVEPIPVDFRLISATHRDLRAMVKAGTFREDLWARLGGHTVELPRLAERREDLATLVAELGERLAPGRGVTFTAEAARALLRHDWPRNVRELERALGASLALAGDGAIELDHLPRELAHAGAAPAAPAVDDPRRDELVAALRAHQGNISAAARALGRPRSQIQRWMRRWGLRSEDYAG